MVNDQWISRNKVFASILILGFIILFTVSCGRWGGDLTYTGVLNDVAVSGLSYSTVPGEISGKTNDQGEFYYKKGDEITFFIGNIEFGSATANNNLSLSDLVSGKTDIDDLSAKNMAMFLQSLDVDSNPDTIELPAGLTDVVNSWLIIQAGRPFGFGLKVVEFESMKRDLMDYLDAQMAVYSSMSKLAQEDAFHDRF